MYFTETKELRDFEKMMQTVPGFDREEQKDILTNDGNSKGKRETSFSDKLKRRR